MSKNVAAVLGLFLLLPALGFAQTTFGLKLAYPTMDALQVSAPDPNVTYSIHSRVPKFGFTGELGLPAGLLLEIDGLYSHLSYVSTSTGADAVTRSTTDINCWDFPLLVKKPFFHGPIRPYVNGGATFRAVNQDTNIVSTSRFGTVTEARIKAPEFIHQATEGFTTGAGFDLKIGKLHLMPEFRYTRFRQENFSSPSGHFHSNLTQPMFVLGVERGK
ncbi:MAG TPA: hypothetical protein VGK48_28960 [Terriglobia bacterium]